MRLVHIMTSLIFLTAFAGMAFAAGVPVEVPEVDPTTMGGAVALLAGGAMLLASRLRRR